MPSPYVPERGDVVWISLNLQAEHEQAGRRPTLVLWPASYSWPWDNSPATDREYVTRMIVPSFRERNLRTWRRCSQPAVSSPAG